MADWFSIIGNLHKNGSSNGMPSEFRTQFSQSSKNHFWPICSYICPTQPLYQALYVDQLLLISCFNDLKLQGRSTYIFGGFGHKRHSVSLCFEAFEKLLQMDSHHIFIGLMNIAKASIP